MPCGPARPVTQPRNPQHSPRGPDDGKGLSRRGCDLTLRRGTEGRGSGRGQGEGGVAVGMVGRTEFGLATDAMAFQAGVGVGGSGGRGG